MKQPKIYFFIVIWLLLASFPFLWTIWGSFKIELDFFSMSNWQNALTGKNTYSFYDNYFTTTAYRDAWINNKFWKNFLNSSIICISVVSISLFIGSLGAYALSRTNYRYSFWLLILALVFRAMPPITIVTGYLYPFYQYNLWGILPTTIIVLVSINQPFTLWMLYSFFQNIPKELDDSAKVDGCSQFQAFRFVILPLMWPGIITAGLFSFLLAYNDFAVTSILLSENNQTMIPKIAAFLGTTYTEGNIMLAVAAVVSATVPLFILVVFFQKYIVSGLTQGAIKG